MYEHSRNSGKEFSGDICHGDAFLDSSERKFFKILVVHLWIILVHNT